MTRPQSSLLTIAVLLLTVGCSPTGETEPALALLDELPPVPEVNDAMVQAGEILYTSVCAACHGADLGGVIDWKDRNDDGTWRPPPMDATGHTWHHSDAVLTTIILHGSEDPASAMAGWGDVLTRADVENILEYLKSTWGPDERRFQWTVTLQEEARNGNG